MANRIKEEEKNEKIIRALLKLPENKRCINCNNLGPQYVCTNFWTFICTNCSGVHREFTHRVKSVSMAKFTSQEVNALKEGGNEHARQIFFKEWDPQRNSYSDSSNIDKLRTFIKHVYVDRRYAGERNTDRPSRAKNDMEDYSENRRTGLNRAGSRSPPYNDHYNGRPSYGGRNDDRNFRYAYGERSPGYGQGDYRRSPRHFEVVDDRYRDDKSVNGSQIRRFEDRRFAEALKAEGGSPNHQKDVVGSSPPAIRPVRDILGDDTPPLWVGDPPKLDGTKRTSSSSSMGSSDGNSIQPKGANSVSLIDFSADSEPPVAAEQPLQNVSQQTNSLLASNGEWASFDAFSQQKAQVPTNPNPLESGVAQISLSESASEENMLTLPVSAVVSIPKTSGEKLPMMQQSQSSLLPAAAASQSSSSIFDVPVIGALNSQPQNSPAEPSIQRSLNVAPASVDATVAHSSQLLTIPPEESSGGGSALSSLREIKSSGRKALPEDFFTSLYPSTATPLSTLQRGPQLGMGYVMQYPIGMTKQTTPQPTTSVNPFDIANETAMPQAPTFPSMASLQGTLPNVTVPPALIRSSSFGVPSPRWVLPQQPSQQLSYPSAISPSLYMMQQVPSNISQQVPNTMMPMPQQGGFGPGSDGAAFGTLGVDQNSTAIYSHPSIQSSLGSVGGNPFG
ncbi:uncharacterized protein [Typha latifolia]|uniref:uncharacterized protein isoform X1 n=1 Tax=Typha latifolia TaxID=4733 RepID=UPI003C2F4020